MIFPLPLPESAFSGCDPLSFRSQLRFPQGFVRAAPALIAAVLSVTGQGWIAAMGQTQSKQGRANLVLEPTHCQKEAKRNKGNWRKWVFSPVCALPTHGAGILIRVAAEVGVAARPFAVYHMEAIQPYL